MRIVAVGLACAASLAASIISAAPPVADFFGQPAFAGAVLSPSGKQVAATVKGGPGNRLGLVVIDLADASKSKAVAGFADADVRTVSWVNDDRLVFTVTDTQSPYGDQLGEGLMAIDREGKGPVKYLIQRRFSWSADRTQGLSVFHRFRSTVRDGSNDVIIERLDKDDRFRRIGITLLRLDTVTGQTRSLTFGGPDRVYGWALDRLAQPRVALSLHENKLRLYWKANSDAEWTRMWERDAYGERADDWVPLAIDANNMLYAAARYGKEDHRSLVRIDMMRKDAEPQSLLSLAGYDFTGSVVLDRAGELVGVRYLTDARGVHWFDAKMKAIQGKVDAMLPATINTIGCSRCEGAAVELVSSWSDRQPTVYRLFDVNAQSLSVIGQSRPWIKPQAMARKEMHRYTSRDGMAIPVYVTRPAGQNAAAAVVLVHGGPWVRGGEWRWDPEAQFLASRGYAVIEPEFRGSTGFGYRLFRAGWKQWGLAMQDDIADATQWAIKQGYADAKRICIAGASYGGYATLMGLVRHSDLYRCGIEWAGVTDIELMYTSRWSDATDQWKDYGMPVLVGDREKDAGQLASTSPVRLAAKVTRPLLMAYGGEDRRVPIEHGLVFREAVASHNKNVEWISYPDEGHGWLMEANKIDFWTRVEKFLRRHLGDSQ